MTPIYVHMFLFYGQKAYILVWGPNQNQSNQYTTTSVPHPISCIHYKPTLHTKAKRMCCIWYWHLYFLMNKPSWFPYYFWLKNLLARSPTHIKRKH